MASTTVEIVSCDRPSCKSEREVQTWAIVGPDGGAREVDLCTRHQAAIADAYALGRPLGQLALGQLAIPRKRGRPRKHVA